MKIEILIIICGCSLCYGQKTETEVRSEIGTEALSNYGDKSFVEASKILTKEVMDAFDELPLGTGESADVRPCYRIFTDSYGKRLTVLKWFLPIEGNPDSYLVMKQLERKEEKWKLSNKKKTVISHEQLKLLESLLWEVVPSTLPIDDWMTVDGFGGTTWIYEFPRPDRAVVLNRWSPVRAWEDDVYKATNVSINRFARESRLTSFTLMLWMISGATEALP